MGRGQNLISGLISASRYLCTYDHVRYVTTYTWAGVGGWAGERIWSWVYSLQVPMAMYVGNYLYLGLSSRRVGRGQNLVLGLLSASTYGYVCR